MESEIGVRGLLLKMGLEGFACSSLGSYHFQMGVFGLGPVLEALRHWVTRAVYYVLEPLGYVILECYESPFPKKRYDWVTREVFQLLVLMSGLGVSEVEYLKILS